MARRWVWVLLMLLMCKPKPEVVAGYGKETVPRNGIVLWLAADDAQPDLWQNPELTGPRANPLSIAGQPTVVPNALNGHAVLRFDGVDDMLKTNIEFGRGKMQAAMVFAVFNSKTDATSPYRKLYGCDDGGFDPAVGLDDRGETKNYCVFTGTGVKPYFTLAKDRYYLTTDIWTWTHFTGYVDGKVELFNEMTDHTTETLPNLYLGGTGPVFPEHWQGDLAEILIYGREVEWTERVAVENYLNTKYGLMSR